MLHLGVIHLAVEFDHQVFGLEPFVFDSNKCQGRGGSLIMLRGEDEVVVILGKMVGLGYISFFLKKFV